MFMELQRFPAVLKAAKARKEELEKEIAKITQVATDRKQKSSQLGVKIQSAAAAHKKTEEKVSSLRSQACKQAGRL